MSIETVRKKYQSGVAPESTRYRFTVPDADTDVVDWIKAQENLSISLRYIIKQAIARGGIVDAFCGPVSMVAQESASKRRGRKPEAENSVGTVAMPASRSVSRAKPETRPASAVKLPQSDNDGFVDPDSFFTH